jgi:membrane protein
MLGGDVAAALAHHLIPSSQLAFLAGAATRFIAWVAASLLLMLAFAVLYYWAPDLKHPRWHWLTPGSAIGILGWLAASLAFRLYIHFFNTYSVTYGSLGAVIILLMWFYISGLMLLVGAEINSEIDTAAALLRCQPNHNCVLAGQGDQVPIPDLSEPQV